MQYFYNISNSSLIDLKSRVKQDFMRRSGGVINGIQQNSTATFKQKATQVNESLNAVVALVKEDFTRSFDSDDDKAIMALIVQYVYTCLSIENRHLVWNYTSIDFSRRIGELWERFCSVAWDYSTVTKRFTPPDFSIVTEAILDKAYTLSNGCPQQPSIIELVNELLHIIGDINLKEDETFYVNDLMYIVDFKSGFGSNEKGNMLRLQAVSRAYKKLDTNAQLLLLVRQNENNNYLNVLRESKTWSIFTGSEAYIKIQELTNVNISWVIQNVVNFRDDLSPSFIDYLDNAPGNPINYLNW